MPINPLIFRAYDIRGIAHVPESSPNPDLTPESIYLIGKAAGSHFKQNYGTNIALGYDCRLSNPELANAFMEGLLDTGCTVTVLGMIFTPLLYFSVCHFNFDGGISITASHNPKEYNGVKLVGKDAHSICGEELQTLLHRIQKQDFEEGRGEKHTLDAFPEYLKKIQSIVHLKRPLKVVADSGNGATGPYVKAFFEALGCSVIPLFTEPDGRFPNHEANPEEEENMRALAQKVQAERADIGFGFDGDGDRVGVVDEQGKHYQADLLLLQLARDLLKRKSGEKIVFDVKVSQVLINDIKAHGGLPIMAKTGHSFIEKTMHEEAAPLGGEISGHLFFAENYYGFDDAFLGAARLLEILSQQEQPFSALFNGLPHTEVTPEFKSPCPDDKKVAIVEAISESLQKSYPCTTIDGVRVHFDENSWGAVRCSNTSPNLTLRFEAPTKARLKEIVQLLLKELRKYPEIDLWWAPSFE